MLRLLPLLVALAACSPAQGASLQSTLADGDLLLQRSRSGQSAAVAAATRSPWTHIGMAFQRNGGWEVLEAVGPVTWTPLKQWVARGDDRDVVVVRHTGPFDASAVRAAAEEMLGLPYDLLFEWSDDAIYCSELVHKAWAKAGIPLGARQTFADLDLEAPSVQRLIEARTTDGVDPKEVVVTPAAFLVDRRLRVVYGTP